MPIVAGQRIPDIVLKEMTEAARSVRILGTFPRWNPGRRGSIGWHAGLPRPMP